jgi:hypothetical protein
MTKEKSLPSCATAGLFSACRKFRAVTDATLTEFVEERAKTLDEAT